MKIKQYSSWALQKPISLQSLDQMLPDYASKENFPSKIFLGKIFVSLFVFLFKIGKTVKHKRNANI